MLRLARTDAAPRGDPHRSRRLLNGGGVKSTTYDLRVDFLDDVQQPRCAECGTVLHNAAGSGYVCRACRVVVIGSVPSLRAGHEPSASAAASGEVDCL